MSKNERTSASVASKASAVLRDPNASPEAKSVAASALTQAPDRGTDGPRRRLSPEGPSSETTTMTKETKKADSKADDKVDTAKSEAEQSREVQKDTVNPDAPAGDQPQDEGLGAKGPGQDSGETVKEIDKTDLRGEPEEYLDGEDNEDVVLTDHDPATKPDEPVTKLEADQLHQADDGRIRTGEDKVAWAPPGSYDAAKNGVHQDASGQFKSVNLPAGARVS